MYVQQLYTNCLAEAAYYIESEGEAAIIDPIRETEPYLEMAEKRGTKIKYVFETHFHADFVSGHIDLAKKTGATIVYGPLADTTYKVHNAKDGEEFKIGSVTIRAIHTPGHTPESTCYLLLDESYQEYCVFTGDTLFIGDVGRPDLLDGKMSKEELAGMLYDSLNKKIKTLPDEVIVYPAHGAGSSCGKNISKETWSTLGEQKKTNYALADMSRELFITAITAGLTAPPAYFFKDAMINKHGYDSIESVMQKNMKALSVEEVEKEIKGGALVLDTRHQDVFEKGFVKSAWNIGLNGMYAIWAGTLIDINKPLVIVAEEGTEEESISRLARVGFEKVHGYLKGGYAAWKNSGKAIDTVTSISPEEFAKRVKENTKILDVRKLNEVEAGHVKDATAIPLAELERNINSVTKDEPVMIHCAGGYRSVVASSIMKANGFTNVINVHGGWNKIKFTDVSVETGVPSNLVAG
jgi:glyoxylase-like metal-dependent hydrolase (beta-lactamase superfamily II)/rhodanese-related sulfurtransferase